MLSAPKVLWLNKSFLDYRVPVYAELDRILGNRLWLLFSKERTPARVREEIYAVLGDRAVGLEGEYPLIQLGDKASDFANKWVEAGYQPGLHRKIEEIDPDLIIGEGFFQWTLPALLFSRTKKRPLVISYERTRHTERRAQWYRTLYRKWVLKHVDAVACNGVLSAEYLTYLGFPRDKVFRGSMAADVEGLRRVFEGIGQTTREAGRSELGARGVVFLYVGQLVARKGVKELLEAWNLLAQDTRTGEATLVIAGDGVERAALEALVRRSERHAVIFAGPVSHGEIAGYYRMADVFIIPTLEDNWSLVVPEAMACELPILSSVFNGCWPELVHPGVNGFTFDPLQPEEIARLLRRFISDPALARRMGAASREIVGEYTPARAASAIHRACLYALRGASDPSACVEEREKVRLAILTNVLTPYRIDFFARVGMLSGILSRVFVHERPLDIDGPPFAAPMGFEYEHVRSMRINTGSANARYLSLNLFFRVWRFRPNAIIVGGAPFAALEVLILKRILGSKLLIWWGGTERSERERVWVVRIWRRWIFKRVDGFLAYSKACARYLEGEGVAAERIKVLGNNTLDVKRWQSVALERAPVEAENAGQFNVLVVSRLLPNKNVMGALDVYERLTRDVPNAALLIVGEGPEGGALVAACRKRKLTDVKLLGKIPAWKMSGVYPGADVLLHMARYDQWPQAINEAMAYGIPVVVSSACGMDEGYVQHGVNGFIVNSDDVQVAAELLRRLAHDRSLRVLMGQRARETARANDVNAVVERFRQAISILC